jgi:hypothetical protein
VHQLPLAPPAARLAALSFRGEVRGDRYVLAMPIVPDDKNWTWVLEQLCDECGFDAAAVDVAAMAGLTRDNAAQWPPLLQRADAARRPTDDQWSALEYACHVRDVYRLFDERLRLMLEQDGPHFANWDQDVTAIEDRYDVQDPATVAVELVAAGEALAARWELVGDDEWHRPGYRSDGAAFTVESFARYFLHDPVHHLADVARGNRLLDG